MAATTFCPFYTKATSIDCWNFIGPSGNGLENKGGYWNFGHDATPTPGTGPTKGHTHGYVYCETNSPTKKGSVFEMISVNTFDFSAVGGISFYYHALVQGVILDVEIWDGYKWVNELSLVPESKDEWIFHDINLNRYHNNDCKIKFKVAITSKKKTYKNDFGLDTITIESFDTVTTDSVDDFVESKSFKRLKKGRSRKRYINETLTTNEVKINISDIEQKIESGEIVLEEDLIIHESESVSHLIKKKR